jgi:hypothetical protein
MIYASINILDKFSNPIQDAYAFVSDAFTVPARRNGVSIIRDAAPNGNVYIPVLENDYITLTAPNYHSQIFNVNALPDVVILRKKRTYGLNEAQQKVLPERILIVIIVAACIAFLPQVFKIFKSK